MRGLKPVAWFLAIVGSPVAAVLWLYHSPRFALRDVGVTFAEGGTASVAVRVPEAWVRETLAPFEGRNLLRLSLAEVTGRLEVHPWVKSVGLSKELPSRLRVRVTERRAVALLRDGGDLFYLDRDGEIIAPLEGTPPHLVTVELSGPWRRPGPALALLGELEAVGPEWLGGLKRILILEENDFVLSTTDLPYPLLVRTGTVADKVRRLRELLPDIMARTGAGAAIDLRYEQRIIIQPSSGSGAAGSVLFERIAGPASGRNS
ncbi:MAG: FtsQ-type POTRA domain-containing protein [Thermoanaerobaculia bacterium]